MLRALHRHLTADGLAPSPAAAAAETFDLTTVAPPSPWHGVPLFVDGHGAGLSVAQRARMDTDGHVVLPAALTPETTRRAIEGLARVEQLQKDFDQTPLGQRKAEIHSQLRLDLPAAETQALRAELGEWGPGGSHGLRMSIGQLAAEHDAYLESIVGRASFSLSLALLELVIPVAHSPKDPSPPPDDRPGHAGARALGPGAGMLTQGVPGVLTTWHLLADPLDPLHIGNAP
jgi:hypothetical protein